MRDDAVCADADATLDNEPSVPKQRRGFALLTPEERRQIAKRGGHAAHEAGTAHRWTKESAAEAGRKGGSAPHASRGKVRASA